ncbi:MAG: metallophosphoesterase [Candidatus Lambdaproteobacteria bacterium]|nr:metallophosphoesterase [Candidatus Lambdaproteobacteria bacterium]
MKLWALSDPHLSFSQHKPMHIFGEGWRNHWEKIERGWRRHVQPGDVVLVTGDISWARRFPDALPDLAWLDRLPGRRKLIVRGNHDHWWPNSPAERGLVPPSLALLAGSALEVAGLVFCGTGGWLDPADPYFDALDHRPFARELGALELALEQGRALEAGRGIHVLIHFPPYTSKGRPTQFDALLRRFPVRSVTYGHLHLAEEWHLAPKGEIDGIRYTLAAADYLGFTPVAVPV